MRTSSALLGIIIVSTSLAVGCAEPPQPAIDAAVSAHQAATTAEAPEYAAEAYRAAEDAQAALDAELNAQAEKMAILRSYDRAGELATAAKTASEAAAQAAADGRDLARVEAGQRIVEAQAAVTTAQDALNKAPKGKGTQQDLMAMGADLQSAATLVADAEAALAAGQFRDARSKADAAITSAQTVTAAVEQALATRRPR